MTRPDGWGCREGCLTLRAPAVVVCATADYYFHPAPLIVQRLSPQSASSFLFQSEARPGAATPQCATLASAGGAMAGMKGQECWQREAWAKQGEAGRAGVVRARRGQTHTSPLQAEHAPRLVCRVPLMARHGRPFCTHLVLRCRVGGSIPPARKPLLTFPLPGVVSPAQALREVQDTRRGWPSGSLHCTMGRVDCEVTLASPF